MTAPIELPDDFDPGAPSHLFAGGARQSVQARMDRVGEWNGFLRLHGVSDSMRTQPPTAWDLNGRVRGSYVPPSPSLGPTNGGIAGRR